jgi:hypothetical protein
MLTDIIQQLIALLIGDIGQPADLFFDIPSQPRDISKIRSLTDRTIPVPEPRRGCAFGFKFSTQLSVRVPLTNSYPYNSNTLPLELTDLGSHLYGGPLPGLLNANALPISKTFISIDKIGHLYTRFGGVIDIAHLRDHADLARYIATQVVALFRQGGEFSIGDDTDPLRDDTGDRVIIIKPQGTDPTAYQAAVLGAFISYEVAVWHEISTFMTMQEYSTFSPEDNYSNLLGTYIGFKACLNELQSYNDAIALTINRVLMNMGAQPRKVTIDVVDYLEDKWYSYPGNINSDQFKPKKKISAFFPDIYLQILKRHCQTGMNENLIDNRPPSFMVTPWLITDADSILTPDLREELTANFPTRNKISINIPTVDENNVSLRNYFTLEVRNAANKDDDLFGNLTVNGTLDSTKFGQIADRLIDKYRFQFGPFVDDPSMAH